ncbi:MAG: hypothetical protein AB1942_26005 [Pseudomonadota bacterium]
MTVAAICILAVALAAAGSVLMFLASPHQAFLKQPLRLRDALALGLAGLVASTVLFLQAIGPAAAVYCVLTVAMAVLTAAPFVAALRRAPPSEKR